MRDHMSLVDTMDRLQGSDKRLQILRGILERTKEAVKLALEDTDRISGEMEIESIIEASDESIRRVINRDEYIDMCIAVNDKFIEMGQMIHDLRNRGKSTAEFNARYIKITEDAVNYAHQEISTIMLSLSWYVARSVSLPDIQA